MELLSYETLLLNHAKTLGFLASRGEEFNPGPEASLDHSELLCNKVLLKYKGDRESFWCRHQKGAERVPPCWSSAGCYIVTQFSSVQSLSRVWLFVTPWIAARQASLSITNSRNSLRLTFIESVMPSSHLILGCPLLLVPPVPPRIKVFPMSQLFTWGGKSTGV